MFSNTLTLLYFLNIVELCVLSFASVFGGFLILIAFQVSIFHRNLALLFCGLYFMASIAISSQSILVIAGFFDYDILVQQGLFIRTGWGKYMEWVRIGGYGGILSFFSSIIVERALATKMLKTYELKKSYLLLFSSSIIAILTGSIGSTIILEKPEWLPYIASLGVLISIFLGTLFVYSYELNKKRYRETKRNSRLTYTLSERFQLQENIRSMSIMKKCVYVICVGNVLILIVIGLQFTNINGVQFLIRKVVNILVGLYALSFNYVAIRNIPAWNRIAKQIFFMFCFRRVQKVWDARTNALENIKGFNGKQLVFTVEKEREVYFKQLEHSWNQ